MDKLVELGFKLGHLDCGLKFGSETNKEAFTYKNVQEEYLPNEVDGGLTLICQDIDKDINIKCDLGSDKLVLVKCKIQVPKSN